MQNGHLDVLERIFVVYYSLGRTFGALVPWQEYYSSSTDIQQSLSVVFSNVVRVVVGVASHFGQATGASATLIESEVSRKYGSLVESTYSQRDQIFDYMWAAAVKSEVGSHGTYIPPHIQFDSSYSLDWAISESAKPRLISFLSIHNQHRGHPLLPLTFRPYRSLHCFRQRGL